ncbi:MAG: right-handed parallel beta-helix repeat-containing protein, partial [Planctomycetota bacterium]
MAGESYLKTTLAIALLMVELAFTGTAHPKTIYVDDDAAGPNNGSSWTDAYNYLQDALTAANDGDEIRVAQGIYKPDDGAGITPGDRTATFQLVDGVTIKGGYAGYGEPNSNARDIELYETILTGDLGRNDIRIADPCDLMTETTRSENSFHVVTGSGTDSTAILDGFTITGGNANGSGGGIYNEFGSPTVINCTLSENYAYMYGGGMYNWSSSPKLTNCKFDKNYVGYYGGGGLYNRKESNPMLTNCIFIENSSHGYAGGMFSGHKSNAKLTNCEFLGNSATWGGAIFNEFGSNLNIINCIFSGNLASASGAGMESFGSNPRLTNCTFSWNSAGREGGGIIIGRSNLTLTNCIFWENNAIRGSQIVVDNYSTMSVSYCDVQGGRDDVYVNRSTLNWGNGNIDTNPLFWNANGVDDILSTEDDNLRLLPGSPCLDAGDNSAVSSSVLTDLDGDPRIKNDTVDMGAYEGPKQGFLLSTESVTVGEGKTATFTVSLAMNPLETIEAAVAHRSGDPDIYVQSHETLTFDSSNYSNPKTVTLAAAEDEDHFNSIALISIRASGFVTSGLAAAEEDNEPYPNILLIDADATGANNGANWKDAFTDLQDALSVVTAIPDVADLQVWVAHGIYKPAGPSGNRKVSFQLATGLVVKGGYAGFGAPDPDARDVKAFETILNGDLNGDDVYVSDPSELLDEPTRSENCYHVVTCTDADATAVLDGFIITGGNANALTGSSKSSNWPNFHGGGMFNEAGSLQISNCIFTANSARYGGGGICSYYACSPTLINCTFIANSGGTYGGGISSYHSNPTINNCIFTGNSADSGGGAHLGSWSPLVNNCTFIANRAYWNGGGIFCFGSSPILTNCTVSGNTADRDGGGIMFYDGCHPLLSNCILWDNWANRYGDQATVADSSTLTISYSGVEGGTQGIYVREDCTMDWGGGNIDADPCFVEPGYWDVNDAWIDGDYHLLPNSPCIDAG